LWRAASAAISGVVVALVEFAVMVYIVSCPFDALLGFRMGHRAGRM